MKLTDIKSALAAYQTGHYPKHGDASRTLETLTKALPHLIAVAEAAGPIPSDWSYYGDISNYLMDNLRNALNELEKA